MTQTKAQLVDLSVEGINANNLNSGTVPDARFPAVLPAVSGANLTNLPAGDLSNLNATNLTSGTIPDARFPATLPAISGANLTNLPPSGISNVVEDTTPELGGNLDVLTREITTSTSNGNIIFSPNGTGAVEIKGDGSSNDGVLQLNCHVNSHGVKIKSPPHSAGQSYTMILPDNQIAQNKFLKVKSITGSGATAVGQLEYADAGGGALEFVSKTELTSNASYVEFSSLDDDTFYRMIAKQIVYSSSIFGVLYFKDGNGNILNAPSGQRIIQYTRTYGTSSPTYQDVTNGQNTVTVYGGTNSEQFGFILDFYTKAGQVWFILNGTSTKGVNGRNLIHGSFDDTTTRISGVRLAPASGTLIPGTQMTLYKFKES